MHNTIWRSPATEQYQKLREAAIAAKMTRERTGKTKSSKQEGLFQQVNKALRFLVSDPKHPSLQTHEFDSIENPYDARAKVFEAYAQNNTPGAYRIFWCYGPNANELTILAITPHP